MNERISRHAMNMSIASVVAERATCERLHVGAIIVRDGRVMSSGYNGNVMGAPHCHHEVTEYRGWDLEKNQDALRTAVSGVPCTSTVHAEANAILFAARHGVATLGATLYTTHQPCEACAKLIINAGIYEVIFQEPYRLPEGLKLLIQSAVVVRQYFAEDDSIATIIESEL